MKVLYQYRGVNRLQNVNKISKTSSGQNDRSVIRGGWNSPDVLVLTRRAMIKKETKFIGRIKSINHSVQLAKTGASPKLPKISYGYLKVLEWYSMWATKSCK